MKIYLQLVNVMLVLMLIGWVTASMAAPVDDPAAQLSTQQTAIMTTLPGSPSAI